MSARILIVDDNPINLKLACDVLDMEGFNIERATRAEQVKAVIERIKLDLILMDIELPGTDGLTLTRQLKADPATRSIPIVAVTAFAMKGDDQKAMEAGCEGYITKPIDTRKFGGQVRAFLNRPGKGEL